MKTEKPPKEEGKNIVDHYTRCGDCGCYLRKERWIRKDNPYKQTKALCSDCLSNYNGPEY